MDRCNELCTKDAAGTCALCKALAERDRFERLWFRKEEFCRGFHVLRQWWYPVHHEAVRHRDVVQEAHKQYSETLNMIMLGLLGVAFFCLLTTLGSSDKYFLVGDSAIKIPFTDALMSFSGFILIAPSLLFALVIYLHIFYGYWIEYDWDRRQINQSSIFTTKGLMEDSPTLFSFAHR